MRIAIISDIHGNGVALDAALADLRRQPAVDQIVCLGDTVQGGAQPAKVIARLRALGCPTVMGNADAWLLAADAHDSAEPVSAEQIAVRDWTLSQLSADDLGFLAGFQPTIQLALSDGRPLICFHGSPHSFDDVFLPDTPEDEVRRLLGAFAPAIMTGGHTHIQYPRRVGSGLYFNPGSIGVVYDHHQSPAEPPRFDPWAEYAILTDDQGTLGLEFRRVPYDTGQLIEALRASGRPHAERAIAQYQRA